ncbi:MAG: winged helix-turn-helix transcriptional regulator [Coprobacillus sp.]|nr:winged helix-turn-helix transcriptional regulator [Coprobacillus sp.]
MYRDPIGYRIKTMSNLMKRSINKIFGFHNPDRATLMHTWIIGFIQEREEKNIDTFQKDIEKEFSINRSTTSEMIKLMCKKGMIKRVAVSHDARLKKIVLTEQSREFNLRVDSEMQKFHQQLVVGLTQEEIDTFIHVADKLVENIKNRL